MKIYQFNKPVSVNSKLDFTNYKLAFAVSETAKTVFWQLLIISSLKQKAVSAIHLLQKAVWDKFFSRILRLSRLFQVWDVNPSLPTGEITRKGLSSSRMGREFSAHSFRRAA